MQGRLIRLSSAERHELVERARSRTGRAEDARRARLILMLSSGKSYSAMVEALDCNRSYVSRWKERFLSERLGGLYARHRGRAVAKRTPRLEAQILDRTRRGPGDGATHWSSRKLAAELGVSHMMVARVWERAGLRPHRLERYMASDDPDFEAKAADIIGLYVNPPQHAAVFCVDEKTAIQALDRLDPVLPLSPGRLERHGFEYYRHGTLSLYAAFNTASGEVIGKTVARHTSQEFVAFLTEVVANQPAGKELHVIADNLSAHKTARVQEFLSAHPTVHLHYTPTYSSWLNQVELWFARIEREVIARGVFTSVKDLARKLMRYIRHYNRHPKPIKWMYRNPQHRIIPSTILNVTDH
jgi:transposase